MPGWRQARPIRLRRLFDSSEGPAFRLAFLILVNAFWLVFNYVVANLMAMYFWGLISSPSVGPMVHLRDPGLDLQNGL